MKITKKNRLGLPKFQTSGTIGPGDGQQSTVSQNAIDFTAGFEDNRGYDFGGKYKAGYTSDASRSKANMGPDYDYVVGGLPEPLQVLLLDTYHNQANPLGTVMLALANNSPELYADFMATHGEKLGLDPEKNAMGNIANLEQSAYNSTKPIYEGGVMKDVVEALNEYVEEAYDMNPSKFANDFTKSRVQRYTSFGGKNDMLPTGVVGTKGQEWLERSLAAGDYAQNLIQGNAQSPDHYYDQQKNKAKYRMQASPLYEHSKTYQGDTPEYFDQVGNIFNQTVQPAAEATAEPIIIDRTGLNADGKKLVITPDSSVLMTPEQEAIYKTLVQEVNKDPNANLEGMSGIGDYILESFDDKGKALNDDAQAFINDVYSKANVIESTGEVPAQQQATQTPITVTNQNTLNQAQPGVDQGFYMDPTTGQALSPTQGQAATLGPIGINQPLQPQPQPQVNTQQVDPAFMQFLQEKKQRDLQLSMDEGNPQLPADFGLYTGLEDPRKVQELMNNPSVMKEFNNTASEELVDDGTFEEVPPEEVEEILKNNKQQITKQDVIDYNKPKEYTPSITQVTPQGRQDFRKNEQAVYNEGRNNYVFGKDSQGNTVRQQVGPDGQILPNGDVKVYRSNEELNQDLGRMRQLVPEGAGGQNVPQIQSRRRGPNFLQQVGQFFGVDGNGRGRGRKAGMFQNQTGTGNTFQDIRNIGEKVAGDFKDAFGIKDPKTKEEREALRQEKKFNRFAALPIERQTNILQREHNRDLRNNLRDSRIAANRQKRGLKLSAKEQDLTRKQKVFDTTAKQQYTTKAEQLRGADAIAEQQAREAQVNVTAKHKSKRNRFTQTDAAKLQAAMNEVQMAKNKGTKAIQEGDVTGAKKADKILRKAENRFKKHEKKMLKFLPEEGVTDSSLTEFRYGGSLPKFQKGKTIVSMPGMGGKTMSVPKDTSTTESIPDMVDRVMMNARLEIEQEDRERAQNTWYNKGWNKLKDWFDPKGLESITNPTIDLPFYSNKKNSKYELGGSLPKFQESGTIGDWRTNTLDQIPGTEGYMTPEQKEQAQYDSLLPKPYGVSRGPHGNLLANNNTNTTARQSPQVTNATSDYNPFKLKTHGNQIQENALNSVTTFNALQQLQPNRPNPLFTPKNKHKKQYAQADYSMADEQQDVGSRAIAQNSRGWGQMMGNLQQLAANMVKAKSKIARATQQTQKQYDKEFMGHEQQAENALTQAKIRREAEDKADYAAKQQALSDMFTERGKGEIERGKLYNSELLTHNQKEYVNQLSNEYKAVTDENGVVSIVFVRNGKVDPQKTAQARSLGQGQDVVGAGSVLAPGVTTGKKGGKLSGTTIKYLGGGMTKGLKKRRNRLY